MKKLMFHWPIQTLERNAFRSYHSATLFDIGKTYRNGKEEGPRDIWIVLQGFGKEDCHHGLATCWQAVKPQNVGIVFSRTHHSATLFDIGKTYRNGKEEGPREPASGC
jgi:hypothetical protein